MFPSIPTNSGHLYFPQTYHSACAYGGACEVLSSSHGLIEMTFLLSKLNYSAPLFICSPAPLFSVHQLPLFLSGPKTCAHKSTDPKNRETITCVFYLGAVWGGWNSFRAAWPSVKVWEVWWRWKESSSCDQRLKAIFFHYNTIYYKSAKSKAQEDLEKESVQFFWPAL